MRTSGRALRALIRLTALAGVLLALEAASALAATTGGAAVLVPTSSSAVDAALAGAAAIAKTAQAGTAPAAAGAVVDSGRAAPEAGEAAFGGSPAVPVTAASDVAASASSSARSAVPPPTAPAPAADSAVAPAASDTARAALAKASYPAESKASVAGAIRALSSPVLARRLPAPAPPVDWSSRFPVRTGVGAITLTAPTGGPSDVGSAGSGLPARPWPVATGPAAAPGILDAEGATRPLPAVPGGGSRPPAAASPAAPQTIFLQLLPGTGASRAPAGAGVTRRRRRPVGDVSSRGAAATTAGDIEPGALRVSPPAPHAPSPAAHGHRVRGLGRASQPLTPAGHVGRPGLSPPVWGGGAAAAGAGSGLGATPALLLAALALALLQALSGRVLLERTAWRSPLFSLRLERPG